jgi:hypothetical protein
MPEFPARTEELFFGKIIANIYPEISPCLLTGELCDCQTSEIYEIIE